MTTPQGQVPEALRPIQRYEVVDCIDSKHVPAVIPNPQGPWVRHEDHAAQVAALTQPAQPSAVESNTAGAVPLYAHPSPPEGMAGWMPIETAPKDGKLILVHFKSKGVRAVSWDSPFHDEVTEENGIWCVDDDKHGPFGLRGYNDDGPTAPTHWMPLPAAPGPADGESNV